MKKKASRCYICGCLLPTTSPDIITVRRKRLCSCICYGMMLQGLQAKTEAERKLRNKMKDGNRLWKN